MESILLVACFGMLLGRLIGELLTALIWLDHGTPREKEHGTPKQGELNNPGGGRGSPPFFSGG